MRLLSVATGSSSAVVSSGLSAVRSTTNPAASRLSLLPPAGRGLASQARHQGVQNSPQVAARSYAEYAAAGPAAEIGEVDYDPAATNSVSLMGVLGSKNDLRVFESGSKLLPLSVGVKPDAKRRPEDIDWVNVEVWGLLAERADEALQKGDRVVVKGRLKIDKWEDKISGQQRTAWKVTANSISKVRSTFPPGGARQQAADEGAAFGGGGNPFVAAAPWDQPMAAVQQQPQQLQQQGQQGAAAGQPSTQEEQWMDFFEHPNNWYDNRLTKPKPNMPDFKKKGGRDAPALWLSGRGTPSWVEGELARYDAGKDIMG